MIIANESEVLLDCQQQGQDCNIGNDTNIEFLLNDDEETLYTFDDNGNTTPVKACQGFHYQEISEYVSSDQCHEPSPPQAKRRRMMLQFESEVLGTSFCEAQNTNCSSDPQMALCGKDDGAKQPIIECSEDAPFKGSKSCMHIPHEQSSIVSSPFGFIKPCAAYGETTLEDINEKILGPLRRDDGDDLFPTATFSGKPVVQRRTVRTKGGKGSVTVLRTKG